MSYEWGYYRMLKDGQVEMIANDPRGMPEDAFAIENRRVAEHKWHYSGANLVLSTVFLVIPHPCGDPSGALFETLLFIEVGGGLSKSGTMLRYATCEPARRAHMYYAAEISMGCTGVEQINEAFMVADGILRVPVRVKGKAKGRRRN